MRLFENFFNDIDIELTNNNEISGDNSYDNNYPLYINLYFFCDTKTVNIKELLPKVVKKCCRIINDYNRILEMSNPMILCETEGEPNRAVELQNVNVPDNIVNEFGVSFGIRHNIMNANHFMKFVLHIFSFREILNNISPDSLNLYSLDLSNNGIFELSDDLTDWVSTITYHQAAYMTHPMSIQHHGLLDELYFIAKKIIPNKPVEETYKILRERLMPPVWESIFEKYKEDNKGYKHKVIDIPFTPTPITPESLSEISRFTYGAALEDNYFKQSKSVEAFKIEKTKKFSPELYQWLTKPDRKYLIPKIVISTRGKEKKFIKIFYILSELYHITHEVTNKEEYIAIRYIGTVYADIIYHITDEIKLLKYVGADPHEAIDTIYDQSEIWDEDFKKSIHAYLDNVKK